MSTPDPRASFEAMTRALIEDFRSHQGEVTEGPFAGRPVLLLTTKGAKTGDSRLAPVVYSRDGEQYVVVASKGGAPTNPAWYLNLVAHPEVTVEVGGASFVARATPVRGPERDRLYAQHASIFPNFVEYQQRTDRVIPVVTLQRID